MVSSSNTRATLWASLSLALASALSAQAQMSFSLTQRIDPSLDGIVSRDLARQMKLATSADGGPAALGIVTPPVNDVAASNAFYGYFMTVGVGNPPQYFQNMLVDTGSANTVFNLTQTTGRYVASATAENSGTVVKQFYGDGASFSGMEVTDTITLQGEEGNMVANRVSFAVANVVQGWQRQDGIIGLGPTYGSNNSLYNPDGSKIPETIPTVLDDLYAQNQIPQAIVSMAFSPATDSNSNIPLQGAGTITFGGVDPSAYVGEINYFARNSNPYYKGYWGFNLGDAKLEMLKADDTTTTTTLAENRQGLVDSGSTLVYLPTDVYNRYMALTNGVVDSKTGLLMIPEATVPTMGNMTLNVGGSDFILSPSAQLFPSEIQKLFTYNHTGPSDTGYYLSIFGQSGLNNGQDMVLGMYFLERYYSVYDTTNDRIGLAMTPYTFEKTTELTSFRRAKRAHRERRKTNIWSDGKNRLSALKGRSPFTAKLHKDVSPVLGN